MIDESRLWTGDLSSVGASFRLPELPPPEQPPMNVNFEETVILPKSLSHLARHLGDICNPYCESAENRSIEGGSPFRVPTVHGSLPTFHISSLLSSQECTNNP